MTSKAERLRSFSRQLKEIPLTERVTPSQWDRMADETELTPDDFVQLEQMRDGHLARAESYAQKALFAEAVEEWTSALQLYPADFSTLKAVITAQSLVGRGTEETAEFQKLLMQRRKHFPRLPAINSNKKKLTLPALAAFITILVLFLGIGVGAIYKFLILDAQSTRTNTRPGEPSQVRTLVFTIDTQGVKYRADQVHCQLLSYPEAHVIETQAWISFPENQITEWSAEVLILDADKKELFKKSITLRSDQDAPLEAGQSLAFFQQTDAQNWPERVSEVFLRTTSIKVKGVEQTQKIKMPLSGTVPAGISLEANLYESSWKTLFDRSIHSLNFEIYNNGLKPIRELLVDIVWKDAAGNVLKTKSIRAVSAYRSELPSGARLPVQVEGEFPNEIFSWQDGQEPKPDLVIRKIE